MKGFIFLLLPFFANAQNVTTIVGTGVGGYSGDGISATEAQLNSPDKVIFDKAGNMYVADEYNHVIRKINTSGIVSTFAGTGVGGYSGDNGPASTAKLKRPLDLVFDASDNMYIAEYGNEMIRRISNVGIISTISGTGTAGYNGDGIPASSAQLNDPLGLVFDKTGNLYFTDNANYRIRKIDVNTGLITTIAGTGSSGYNGDGIAATAAQIRLTGYSAFNTSGEFYFGDYGNHRVRKIDRSGIVTTVVGTGVPGTTGDNGPATAAAIHSPIAIIFDPAGNMYISDGVAEIIRKVNTSGIISTIAGNGIQGYAGDDGPASTAEFNTDVNCSAIDIAGNLYIADPLNNRVRKISYHNEEVNEMRQATYSLILYPNPAHSEISVKADRPIENVEVINVIGASVTVGITYNSLSQTEGSINISRLPGGMYFVKVSGVYAGRFVKE